MGRGYESHRSSVADGVGKTGSTVPLLAPRSEPVADALFQVLAELLDLDLL